MKKKKHAKSASSGSVLPAISLRSMPVRYWLILGLYLVLSTVLIRHTVRLWQAEYYFKRADGATHNRAHADAAGYLEQSVRYAPWEIQYRIYLGRAYESAAIGAQDPEARQRYVDLAFQAYSAVLDREPLNAWHAMRLGDLYTAKAIFSPQESAGFLRRAFQFYQQAETRDFNNPLFKMKLAFFYQKYSQDLDMARRYYERALDLDPTFPEAHLNLAYMDAQRHDLPAALGHYLILAEAHPTYNQINLYVAQTYVQLNQIPEAIPFLQKQLALTPYEYPLIRYLGLYYYRTGQWDAAATYLKRYYEGYPNDDSITQKYINALMEARRFREAKLIVQLYLETHPQDTVGRGILDALKRLIP